MSETLNHYPEESDNPIAQDEWESVSEQEYSAEKPVTSEQRAENTADMQQTKEETIVAAKEKVISAISTQEQAFDHEQEVDRAEFMGVKVPRALLGEERIFIDYVEPRKNDGLFGLRKSKDQKKLQQLLQDTPDEEILKKELTPQIAYDYLEFYKEHRDQYSGSQLGTFLIESLPLKEQEKIFDTDSDESVEEYLSRLWVHDNDSSLSFTTKKLIGATKVFEKHPSAQLSDIRGLTDLASSISEEMSTTDESVNEDTTKEELFNTIIKLLEGHQGEERTKEQKNALSKAKIYIATSLLSEESFDKHFDEIVDKEYVGSEGFDLRDLYEIRRISNTERTEKKLLEMLPPHLHRFAEQHMEMILNGNISLDQVNDQKMEEVEELVTKCSESIPDEKLLYTAALSGEKDYTHVMEMMIGANIDEPLVKNIRKYLELSTIPHRLKFMPKMPVENLEELRDYQATYENHLQKEIKDIIDSNPDRVRELMSYYLYGQPTSRIGQCLTALGVVEMKSLNGLDFNTDWGYDTETRRKIHINNKKLAEIKTSNEMTDVQKRLILDAIDLICCKDKDLIDRFEMVRGKNLDGSKLGDVLSALRATKMKEVSANYAKYMEKTVRENARNVGETSYDGKKIPILEMVGDDDFMILIHHLGVYSSKSSDTPPQEWNERAPTKLDENGKPVGYISTCAIAPGCMKMAAQPRDIKAPDEIYYGFTNFGEDALLYTAEYDLYTKSNIGKDGTYETTTTRQYFIDPDPHAIIERTKKATSEHPHLHNEVVLNRYSGTSKEHGGKLQPDYLVVFSSDSNKISENVKKHAAYFGVPILIIDYDKYEKG